MKQLLETRGISVRQAAEDLGVSPYHLRFVLYGRTHPSPKLIDEAPNYLGVSLSDLFTPEALAKKYDGNQATNKGKNQRRKKAGK